MNLFENQSMYKMMLHDNILSNEANCDKPFKFYEKKKFSSDASNLKAAFQGEYFIKEFFN